MTATGDAETAAVAAQPSTNGGVTIDLGVVVTPALDERAVEKLAEDLSEELSERYPSAKWEITVVRGCC